MDTESTEVTDIITYIGTNGVFQIALFFSLGCMEYLGVDSISMNFMGGFMDHWCKVEPLQNYSYAQQQYIAIPDDPDTDNKYDECYQFPLNFYNYTEEEFYSWDRDARTMNISEDDHVYCESWVYDRSEYASTIRSRWDLVCDDNWMVEMVSSVYMAGRLIGAVSCGVLSDWLGRKAAILVFNFIRAFGAVLCLYAPEYISYSIARFLIAAGSTGANLCAFVLITEVVGNKNRAAFGSLWQCIFSLGYMSIPGWAYFIRDESKLQAVNTWPLFLFFIFAITIPESPRWLLSQNREEEAEEIVHFIGEVNHKELPSKLNLGAIYEQIQKQQEDVISKKGTLGDLFKYPNLRKKTLIIYFNWFTNSLVYYGLSLNTGRLAGSIYLNTFLMGAIEIPANFLAIYLMNKIGRKWQIGWSCIFGGVASVICVILILTDASSNALTAMSILGKAGITMAFTGIYVYSVEIFPTGVRNAGIGSSSMCARISGMAAPFVGGPLADVWEPLPSLIFAVFALASGLLMFLGPETLNKRLPETIEEAEAFGKKSDLKVPDSQHDVVSMKEISPSVNPSGQSTNQAGFTVFEKDSNEDRKTDGKENNAYINDSDQSERL